MDENRGKAGRKVREGGLYQEKLDDQLDDNPFFGKPRTIKGNKQDDMVDTDEVDHMDEKK